MTAKRAAKSVDLCEKKKWRKMINLEMKFEVFGWYEAGERPSEIFQALNLTFSTVRTIKFSEEKIKECAQSVT